MYHLITSHDFAIPHLLRAFFYILFNDFIRSLYSHLAKMVLGVDDAQEEHVNSSTQQCPNGVTKGRPVWNDKEETLGGTAHEAAEQGRAATDK